MRRMMFITVLLLGASMVEASHFRGGTVTTKHIKTHGGGVQEIDVNFRLGYRRTSSTPACNDTLIASQQELFTGVWKVTSPAQNSSHSAAMKCTTFDVEKDWAYGFNSFRANVSEMEPFTVQFTGGDWISSLVFGASSRWSIKFVNEKSGVRSDTGLHNRPPSTFSSPIIRLQRGCPSDIKITYHDDDKDNVFCRYAIGDEECAGICGSYSSFTLDQKKCVIRYDGLGQTGLVPVALILEDYPVSRIQIGNDAASPSDYLSQVPLQFLVEISNSTDCNVRPSIQPKSIPEGAEFVLWDSGSFNRTIYASPSQRGLKITSIVILGPLGIQKSPIEFIGNDTFISKMTWQPTKDQVGKHDVCYYAVDENGKSSEQTCFVLTVSEKINTCETDNGGCSDICIPANETNTCACSKPCWELDPQGKICLPRTNISCTGTKVSIEVDKCATGETVVAGLSYGHFSTNKCQSKERFSKHELDFTPHQCGTELEMSATGIKYNVKMWVWHHFDESVDSSTIVRGEWRLVPLSCSFPGSQNITSSFLPLPALNDEIVPNTVVVAGMGTFQLHFDFYRSSKFVLAYTKDDYPLVSSLEKDFNVELRAEGRRELELFVKDCFATTAPLKKSDTLNYPLIENGCIMDNTTTFHETSNKMTKRFSFQAFEFHKNLLLSRKDYSIYVTCEVIICDTTVNNTRCSRGCLPTRQKRSVDEIEIDDDSEYVESVSQSPANEITRQIQIVFPEEHEKESDSTEYIKWIVVAACNVCLLLALVIVFYIVRRKQRTNQKQPETA